MSDLPELETYQHALRSTYVSRSGDEVGRTYYLVDEDAADDAIAALERACTDRERCGNCIWWDWVDGCGHPDADVPRQQHYRRSDRCHFIDAEHPHGRWELCE